MSWITCLEQHQQTPRSQKMYARIADENGEVDNILKVHSLRPHTLEAHMALYKATLHHSDNTLSTWLLECIGIYVSRLNRCDYCDHHHTAGLKRLVADGKRFDELEKALAQPFPGEPFTTQEQALMVYVRQLTICPGDIRSDDIARLLAHGYDDGQILEVNQVAAYFAYANRTVLGLGVDWKGETLGLAPPDSDQLDEWQHH